MYINWSRFCPGKDWALAGKYSLSDLANRPENIQGLREECATLMLVQGHVSEMGFNIFFCSCSSHVYDKNHK